MEHPREYLILYDEEILFVRVVAQWREPSSPYAVYVRKYWEVYTCEFS